MIIFTFTPFPFIMAAQQIYLRCIKKKNKSEESSELESNNSCKVGVSKYINSFLIFCYLHVANSKVRHIAKKHSLKPERLFYILLGDIR